MQEFIRTLATGVDPLSQALNTEFPPETADSDK